MLGTHNLVQNFYNNYRKQVYPPGTEFTNKTD